MTSPFAKRVQSISIEGAYGTLGKARALEAQGRDIVHLEIGQPDYSTPQHVVESAYQAMQEGHTKYTFPSGTLETRETIARKAGDQRDMTVSAEEIVVGPGAKPLLFLPCLALVEPGDEVIMPDPGFPTYRDSVLVAGGVPVPVELDRMRGFDLQKLEARISDRTRMIILNSPSNPTGGVTSAEDLETIAKLAKKHDTWVLSDEIYSRLVYDDEARTIATLPGMRERTIVLDGFSKTYSMPGWRLGYAIVPQALAERLAVLLVHAVGCTADFTQVAGMSALEGDQSQPERMREEYKERRNKTVVALNEIPGVSCDLPQGAFYVFPDVRSFGRSSREIADFLLDDAGVALLPGTDFGEGGEGFLRISYATAWERIELGIERIKSGLAKFA